MAVELVGAAVMESLHLLQNVIQDVPFCPATAGERAVCVCMCERLKKTD